MDIMEGSYLITRVLPVVTIILAVVFFLALKLIGRAKRRALGEHTKHSLAGLQFDLESENEEPERLKLICPAFIEKSQGVLKVSLRELTPSGAFLTCPNPRPIGQTFQVRFLIDGQKPLSLDAEVLWNNQNVSADTVINRGMRVRFLQLLPDDRKALSEIMNKPRQEDLFT